MSFTGSTNGSTFNNGFFLVNEEDSLRETAMINADHAQVVTRGRRKIVPMGAVVPANDATAKGILYEDIDVTDGDALCSIVTIGKIYEDRLPAALASAAKTALTGITIENSPSIVRPAIFAAWHHLDVKSVAGSSAGNTTVTTKGHQLGTGESYVYKVDDKVYHATLGTDLTGWTAWNGSSDITAATGKILTVAVKNADGKAVAGGATKVTAKA